MISILNFRNFKLNMMNNIEYQEVSDEKFSNLFKQKISSYSRNDSTQEYFKYFQKLELINFEIKYLLTFNLSFKL